MTLIIILMTPCECVASPPRTSITSLSHTGSPVGEIYRVYDSFAACYDPRTRCPKWVLEHITAKSLEGDANRWGRGWQRLSPDGESCQ